MFHASSLASIGCSAHFGVQKAEPLALQSALCGLLAAWLCWSRSPGSGCEAAAEADPRANTGAGAAPEKADPNHTYRKRAGFPWEARPRCPASATSPACPRTITLGKATPTPRRWPAPSRMQLHQAHQTEGSGGFPQANCAIFTVTGQLGAILIKSHRPGLIALPMQGLCTTSSRLQIPRPPHSVIITSVGQQATGEMDLHLAHLIGMSRQNLHQAIGDIQNR